MPTAAAPPAAGPPRVQVLLKLAYRLQERLRAAPGLTQAALAAERAPA